MGQQVPKIHPTDEEWEGEAAPTNEPVHTLGHIEEDEKADEAKVKLEERLNNAN